jgi:hypothetical protein
MTGAREQAESGEQRGGKETTEKNHEEKNLQLRA